MSDPEATNPGLTQNDEGEIFIGKGASKASLDRALEDQRKQMQAEQDALNEELTSGRTPGSPVGDDGPENKKTSPPSPENAT